MTSAEQRKHKRESLGLSPNALAQMLGVSPAEIYDLESHDGDISMVHSIEWVFAYARALGMSAVDLIGFEESVHTKPLTRLAADVMTYCEDNGFTPAQFSEICGWDVREIIESPARTGAVVTLDALDDICRVIGQNTATYLSSYGTDT